MFCIKISFWSRSRSYIGGAGAEIFYLEPEPKKNIWSRSRGKMSLGSATLNTTTLYNVKCSSYRYTE